MTLLRKMTLRNQSDLVKNKTKAIYYIFLFNYFIEIGNLFG